MTSYKIDYLRKLLQCIAALYSTVAVYKRVVTMRMILVKTIAADRNKTVSSFPGGGPESISIARNVA